MMNKDVVLKWFEKYPTFENFIGAGTISLKAAREILQVDRYFMYDIYLELLEAGAIRGVGSNAFRASPELQKFLKERREERGEQVE